MNFWKNLKRPIKVLAPMAGYTDSAFRLLCKEAGADVVVTELISADAIAYGKFRIMNHESRIMVLSANSKPNSTGELLSFSERERPIVVQLFGKYPEKFGLAAKWITENLKPDGIDINMGCPARKVVGSDHGAALLKNPDLAVEIVEAVKANTNLPVSVKTRLGWDNDDEILGFAPRLAEAGIDAIIIHGRTYKDGFKGEARWENIYKVKEILGDKVVVIGNGDIGTNTKIQETITKQISNFKKQGLKIPNSYPLAPNILLDGVAIGRATFGKPWIFSGYGASGIEDQALKKTILKHAELTFETKGAKGIIEFRKHLLAYLKGFPNAKELRRSAVRIENMADVESVLSTIELQKA